MKLNMNHSYAPVFGIEVYWRDSFVLDVAKAWRIIAALTPQERAARLETVKLTPGLRHKIDTHRIDIVRALQATLTVPVLVATGINERDGSRWSEVVDGYHRLYRAQQLGKRSLPGFRLTIEETQACIQKGGK